MTAPHATANNAPCRRTGTHPILSVQSKNARRQCFQDGNSLHTGRPQMEASDSMDAYTCAGTHASSLAGNYFSDGALKRATSTVAATPVANIRTAVGRCEAAACNISLAAPWTLGRWRKPPLESAQLLSLVPGGPCQVYYGEERRRRWESLLKSQAVEECVRGSS